MFLFCPINAQENVIDEIICIIGDEAIFYSDLKNLNLQMQLNQNQQVKDNSYCTILKQLIIQKLYLHQAYLDSIDIPKLQISHITESWINYVINQIGSKKKVEEYFGKSIGTLRKEKKQMVKEQCMIQLVQNKLINNIKVTPSEVRDFYNHLLQDSLPCIPTTVELKIITLNPIITLTEIDNIKRKLREYTELINSGEREFSMLARIYSEDIESARRGGELGLVSKKSLPPEFSTAAFALNNLKKVSEIVKTEYGYHIIQLIEKKGNYINVRHIFLKPHAEKKEFLKAFYRLDSIRSKILSGKLTFDKAVTNISQDIDSRNNKGIMINQISKIKEYIGTSRFAIEELPSEISKIICNMQIGDISKPFTMVNFRQKEIVAMIKLQSKVKKHKANYSNDYYILKNMLERDKQNKILAQWLDQKRKELYIHISDTWKNCDF